MLLSLPIIYIKLFLAILHAGSSGVVNVAGAAVKRVLLRGCVTNWTTDCSIKVYRSFQQTTANSSSLSHKSTTI